MSRWCNILCAALFVAPLALILGGCKAEVGDNGKLVLRRVWFDAAGKAHCPLCDPEVKLEPGSDAPPSLVKPRRSVCEQEAHHHVLWGADDVPCWRCGGTGICPDCGGSGLAGGRGTTPCTCTAGEGSEGAGAKCLVCKGRGVIEYGG
jgi:hypothetical protein